MREEVHQTSRSEQRVSSPVNLAGVRTFLLMKDRAVL